MKSKTRSVQILFHLAVLFFVLAAPAPTFAQPRPQDRIKIGVIAGFSGDFAAYGTAFRTGIELAEVSNSLEFIYEDDQFIPARSLSAFNKLVEIDKIQAAIVGDTVTASALASIAKRRGIPILVWASEHPTLRGSSTVLRLWSKDSRDFGHLTKILVEQSSAGEKTAVFTSTHTYAEAWGNAVVAALGDAAPLHQAVDFKDTDLATLALKVKAGKFSRVGICLNSPQNGFFLRHLKEQNIQVLKFACNFVESSADLNVAREAFDNLWFTAPPVSENFRTRYVELTKSTDHILSAAVLECAAKVLAAAAEASGHRIDHFSEAVKNIKEVESALGKVRVVHESDDWYLDLPFTRYRINGGKIALDN